MSEFECKYGHLMSSHETFCIECAKAGRPMEIRYRMDGMTSAQLNRMEREERRTHGDEEDDGYPD